jgi:8-oxo-dGTP diphosphatase
MPHIHDKIDFCVEVFIVHKDRVLLRMHDKYKIWLSVGGHIELDEDPNEAALREVQEEVGLTVELIGKKFFEGRHGTERELIPPRGIVRHNINEIHEHVVFIYFAKADTFAVVEDSHDKSGNCKWFTSIELDSKEHDILPSIRFYAKKALAELGELKHIHKYGLLVRDGDRFLVNRKRGSQWFILPGGKVDAGETPEECLARELAEEHQCTIVDGTLRHIADVEDFAANEPGTLLHMGVYSGSIAGIPIPGAEIEEQQWFHINDDPAQLSAVIRNHVLPLLKQTSVR